MTEQIIFWERLSHCPENQLVKAGKETDAGWDIAIAEYAHVPPYSHTPYSWITVGFYEELAPKLPDLFSSRNYDIFLNREGLCTTEKYVLSFAPEDKPHIIKELNRLNAGRFEELTNSSYIVENSLDIGTLQLISGVVEVEKKVVVQRRKYQPKMIKTGIKIQPSQLMWNSIQLRSSCTKIGIAQAHGEGVVDFKQTTTPT